VLATWIIGVELFFLVVVASAIVFPEAVSLIPDSQLLSGAEKIISDHPRALLIGLLPMLSLIVLICTVASWTSNYRVHKEMRKHVETRPRRYSHERTPPPGNEAAGP